MHQQLCWIGMKQVLTVISVKKERLDVDKQLSKE